MIRQITISESSKSYISEANLMRAVEKQLGETKIEFRFIIHTLPNGRLTPVFITNQDNLQEAIWWCAQHGWTIV